MAQMNCLRPFLYLSILLTLIMMIPKTCGQSYYCSNDTMFANNSAYKTNLNTLLNSLTSNATNNPNGYHAATVGKTTSDTVYGHFLCRGDQNTSSCRDCVTTATTTDLPKKYCPNRKVAVIWYDQCLVRYSNESFFGKLDQSIIFSAWNVNNITGNVSRFQEILGSMMVNVIAARAAEGGSLKKFATDVANYTVFQTIYGLGQCTPDLSPSDCNQCLNLAIQSFKPTQGGRIMFPSCDARYEIYPFFNLSSLPPPPQSAPTSNSTRTLPGTSQGGKKKVSIMALVAIVVVSIIVVSVAIISICFCIFRKKAMKLDFTAVQNGEDFSTDESLQYDLEMLQTATNNFSSDNKLGEGGFGDVYKGTLPNGKEIAVKRLSRSSNQGVREFKSEIMLVAKLQHRNLVRVIGFCLEGAEKLLVYEYVPNNSLDKLLFDPIKQGELNWGMRYKIIGGIARGMLYLHHDSQLKIIHRDLKASNILLDMDMNPKISDFGMAKIFGVDQTQGNTSRVVGTYGYMAPEYAMHGQFSIRSDVYSFGVLVLEIISGKRNSAFYESGETEDLVSYAWKQWRDNMPLEFVDPTIRDSCSSSEVMRCIHLGLLCVQESMEDRPTMATIVLTLDSYSVTLPVPEQPAFTTHTRSKAAKGNGSDQSSRKSPTWSVNDVSVTEPEPR